MISWKHVTLVTFLAFALIIAGCCGASDKADKAGSASFWQPAGSGDVLATVGNIKIYLSDFAAQLEQKPPYVRSRYNTDEKKKEFLDSLITFETLSQAAIEKGLDKDPKVVQAAKQTMIRLLMENEIEKKFTADDIPEADMKAYYDAHPEEFNNPERRRAAHILIKVAEDAPETQWQEARKKAEKVLAQVKAEKDQPNSFRKLAKEYSDDTATNNRGGDLSYFSRTEEGGPMVKAFSDAVFTIENTNDIVGPVRSKFGWHVIKLTGKLAERNRTFEQVMPRIKRKLFKERQQELFDKMVADMKARMNVQIDEKALSAYVVPGAKEGEATEAPAGHNPHAGQPGTEPTEN
jgi:parvulin-like peptidyl-prolyl isomerase